MDREKIRRAKKSKLISLARRSNIRGAHLMSKERLIDRLSRVSAKKSRTKKVTRPRAEKVIRQIKTLPQYRLRERLAPSSILEKVVGQQKVEEAKYYIGPIPEYKSQENFEFPYGYGDNRIVALVRDPWWLYSYWEITADRENEARDKLHRKGLRAVKSILRVYDVTDINFNGDNAHSYFDIELTGLANNWYINVGAPNRAWIIEIGILANNGDFVALARSNCVRTPRFGMSDIIDEEWMCQEDDYWKMFGLSGGFGMGKASLAMREMFKKRLLQQVSSGAVSSLSSPVKKALKQKGFWLMVDAELIIYGQTEPDAKLTVQNKPVRLRKDGSFSLRFALPDGKQEIPVSATSFDGDDTRTITPIVTRRTT
ncbi:MAG: DUF4912 domain-containing protein [Candidatus Omnitrophica bacterium]|nr:DUF4912 domain-containing protein [Candidatus Omnitrophota bacterium]